MLCNTINELIKKTGYKKSFIAKKAGYTSQQLSNLLNGRKIITALDIVRICNVLNTTPNELLGITNDKNGKQSNN